MYKVAVIVALCSLLLVIPTLTWRNKVEEEDDWFQSDDPLIDAYGNDGSTNEAASINSNGASFIKQRFHYNSVMQLNGRINDTLSSSYTYMILAFYFDRADVALPGFSKFFMSVSETERENAMKLMKYMNKRGGWFKLRRIVAEEREWKSGLQAMEYMLEHAKSLNANFLYTHKVASESDDGHLTDFIEGEFLEPKAKFIKKLGEHITNLRSFKKDYNLGEWIFDDTL